MPYSVINSVKLSDIPLALPSIDSLTAIPYDINFNYSQGPYCLGDTGFNSSLEPFFSAIFSSSDYSVFSSNPPSISYYVPNTMTYENGVVKGAFGEVTAPANVTWHYGNYNQISSDSDNLNAAYSSITSYAQVYFTSLNSYQRPFNSAISGNVAVLASLVASPFDIYLYDVSNVAAPLYGAFTFTEPGDDFGSCFVFGLIPNGGDYYSIWSNNLYDNILLAQFTPQLNAIPSVFNISTINFDDPTINTEISAGNFNFSGNDANGFFIILIGQVGYFGEVRIIHLSYDGLTYNEILLSGDANTSAFIISNSFYIASDLSSYYPLASDGINSYLFVNADAPIFTRNPRPVKLECSNYCIPFIKQRKNYHGR